MKLNDLNDSIVFEGMADHTDSNSEMGRIVAHWQEHGKGMSKDELADAIGMDLEQLEYSPEEAAKMIPAIVAKVLS